MGERQRVTLVDCSGLRQEVALYEPPAAWSPWDGDGVSGAPHERGVPAPRGVMAAVLLPEPGGMPYSNSGRLPTSEGSDYTTEEQAP